jgi:nucleotide-binding universal stress UspA family protein
MKKIIAAFDGLRFSDSTLEYAIYLSKQYDAHIVGVFLSESTKLSYAVYEIMVEQSVSGAAVGKELEKSDAATMNESVIKFESACKAAKINYSVHRDEKKAANELLHETVFADLLVIDANETFSYLEASLPGGFLKNILHDAQCPVMVVPKKFKPITKLALLYDGQPSSIFAIKMLGYVLPEMTKLEAKFFYAEHGVSSLRLPDNKLMKEWVKRHFSNVEYHLMKGEEKKLVATIAAESSGILIVAGAYHRSNLSMWFHNSLADLLMNEIKTPLFIAHH